MSLDLDLVSQIMSLRKQGEVNLGDEAKVVRCENKIVDWQRDVGDKQNEKSGLEKPTKEEISVDSSLPHTIQAHNPAQNPLRNLSCFTHLLKHRLSSLT
jgi:hypothetical protein